MNIANDVFGVGAERPSFLITGGTGSFGSAFVTKLLEHHDPSRVVIFSRDELKQYEMRQRLPSDGQDRIRFFLGDVRDLARLNMAMRGIDYVVHAAALKQVDTAEYNPMEFVKTNILGSENVVQAAIANGVKKVVALSTDKASSPVNLYGATKLTADKLFVSSNHYVEAGGTRFAVVRYGNVMGSRGSVIPFFQDKAARGEPLPITDSRMTRFWITLDQAYQFVCDAIENMVGGEIFIPKIPSVKIIDLAKAINSKMKLKFIGIRPGEKLHESLISKEESANVVEFRKYFIIRPSIVFHEKKNFFKNAKKEKGKKLTYNFEYNSFTNKKYLSVNEIKKL